MNQSTKIQTWLTQRGYAVDLWEENNSYVDLWAGWHRGYTPFHDYEVDQGTTKTSLKRKSLGMAKKICETYADMLLNEKVDYNIGDEQTTELYVDKFLDSNDWHTRANLNEEWTMALGTTAYVKRLTNLQEQGNTLKTTEDTEVAIDFVTAKSIIPKTFNKGKITECAFITENQRGDGKNITVSEHLLDDNNNYKIVNTFFYQDKNGTIKEIELEGTAKEFYTRTKEPWFHIRKTNISNNINPLSPYGVSIFHNSIDLLKGIDLTYDSLINEFMLGKKRIIIDPSTMKRDEITGDIKFDTNDLVFYQMEGLMQDNYGDSKSNKMLEFIDPTLRTKDHIEGLNAQLSLLSSNVGLGADYFSLDKKGGLKTATEVVSDNSDLYRSIKKQEISLEDTLIDFFASLIEIDRVYKLTGVNTDPKEVSIDFDDSVIEDTNAIFERNLKLYQLGLISKEQFFMNTEKFTSEQAQEFVQKQYEDENIEEEPEEESPTE